MSIRGFVLPLERGACSYFDDRRSATEVLIIDSVSDNDFVTLLNRGFRHFGRIFFRPHCPRCRRCIPIRVDVRRFRYSRSLRRVLSKAAGYTVSYGKPFADRRIYELYASHKQKFGTGRVESYAAFRESFCHAFPFSYQLSIFDQDRLVAVSFFDAVSSLPGENLLSAVYCFYDPAHEEESPGTLAILKEIEFARRHRIPYVYLGYFIENNRHMNYKSRFYPNQLLEREHEWVDFIGPERVATESGRISADSGFLPDGFVFPGV